MTNKYIEQLRPVAEKNGYFGLPTDTGNPMRQHLADLLTHLSEVQRLGIETGVLKPAYMDTIDQLTRNAQKRIKQLDALRVQP